MRFSGLFAAAACVAGIAAAPAGSHVLHEKRESAPPGWMKRTKLPGHMVMPMRIALAQSNMDKLDDWLMEVSDPASEKYGKHWSHEDIAKAFEPSQETHDSVRAWLSEAGISEERITVSKSRGWVHFDASVEEAEKLLKTEYFVYEHVSSGTPQAACEEYHLPEGMRKHVDFVTPTLHFDAKVSNPNKLKRDVAAANHTVAAGAAKNVVNPGNLPKPGAEVPQAEVNSIIGQLQNCDKTITPDCLRALYQIPPFFGPGTFQKNPYGIVEYTPESYLQSDLNMFFANFSKNQKQKTPDEKDIDGGFQETTLKGFEYQGEPDLDLQYGMALVNPIPVTLYQVGDAIEGASFNNFLDAIDGSYCKFEGGDDPTQDGIYPDPYGAGYEGPEACGTVAPTKVISTSYAYNEADLTAFYEMRQCQEYAKLGMAGTTVLYSSGDYGVAGNGGQCINPNGGGYTDGSYGKFNPSFPGTCPYITSVGATQVKPNSSVTAPEEACETVIYSGGGFSNVFPIPSYQKSAIATYYAQHNPPYGADRYNNSRQVRGLPDVSANGANYLVAIDGTYEMVYGTSASTPVFGSIVTIVNELRAEAGKGPIGFLNPTIYANPWAFNDITSGTNQGCGTTGFSAVPGWDPVTGLGTPNTPKLIALFLSQ